MSRTGQKRMSIEEEQESSWKVIAEHQDVLEYIVESDMEAFSDQAERLLDELERREVDQ